METQTGGTKGETSINQANKDESNSRMEGFIKDELNYVLNEKEMGKGEVDAGRGPVGNEENPAPIGDGQKVSFLKILMIF